MVNLGEQIYFNPAPLVNYHGGTLRQAVRRPKPGDIGTLFITAVSGILLLVGQLILIHKFVGCH